MSCLRLLVDAVERAGVFKRNETPLEVKVLAAMLCFSDLSYRVSFTRSSLDAEIFLK
jgi:hypothetical protein